MKILCLSGKAQHGKDTVATMLTDSLEGLGNKVLTIHYADLLKFICKTYLKWDGEKDERGRTLLQWVGTDNIRRKSPNYWVDNVIEILQFFPDEWDYVIIPDCRFPNEIHQMKEAFPTVHIRVIRTNFESPLTEEQQHHESEVALDDESPDYSLLNEGTLDDLRERVHIFVMSSL